MKWIFSIALAASLASNAWLAFRLMDAGVTQAYMGESIQKNRTALLQCIAVTNEVLATDARQHALVAKAKLVAGTANTFSNDGHLWVGPFGMNFDEDGKLVTVAEWDTVYGQVTRETQ